MRIIGDKNGYTMWLNVNDTYNWATRPDNSWPCSQLKSKRLVVSVDSNGLCDLHVSGIDPSDVTGDELDALVSDHLPEEFRHLWPTWEKEKVE